MDTVALDDCCQQTGASVAAALAIIHSYSHLAKCTFTSRRISGCARLREAFFVSLRTLPLRVGAPSSDYEYCQTCHRIRRSDITVSSASIQTSFECPVELAEKLEQIHRANSRASMFEHVSMFHRYVPPLFAPV